MAENETPTPQRPIDWFATGWSVFAGGYLTAITFLAIPKENIRFADMFSGFLLGTVISALIQFRYGSSVSSRKKDETIATQLQAPKDSVNG